MYLTLVVSHNGLDMFDEAFFQHFLRGRRGCVAIGEPPVRGLRVPHQAVADNLQVVLLTVVDELVSCAEVENAFSRGQRFGFHAVLSDSTVEVLVDYDISLGHLSVALPLVDSSTDEAVLAHGVLQPLGIGGDHTAYRHYADE